MAAQEEVLTVPLVFCVEWEDHKWPVFWCVVASPFHVDLCRTVRIPSDFTQNPQNYMDYSMLIKLGVELFFVHVQTD